MRLPLRGLLPAVGLALLLTTALDVAPAAAQFAGRPGPLVYRKVSVGAGQYTGGFYLHGPHLGDAARQLTAEPEDRSPSFSPDGRLIAFVSNRHTFGERFGHHVFVMRSDGSGVRQLTRGEVEDANPSFSPDGKAIVFDRRERNADRTDHIFRVGAGGGEPTQLTSGRFRDSDPVYTPSGRAIVFVSDRRPQNRHDPANIFSMRPGGSRIRLLIAGPRRESGPDVSPNGRAIAFAGNRPHGHGPDIYVARLNGRHMRRLTHSKGDCFRSVCYADPVWSPDGRHVAYLHESNYGSSVEVTRADGRLRAGRVFDRGGIDENGYGVSVDAPSWAPRPG